MSMKDGFTESPGSAPFKRGDMVLVTCDRYDMLARGLGDFEVGRVTKIEKRSKRRAWIWVQLYLSHISEPIFFTVSQCEKVRRDKNES